MAIPVLLWALSGLLHPIMANWMRPSIAKTFLIPTPIQAKATSQAPSEVFADIPELHQIHLREIEGKLVYQAITPDQELYYRDSVSGEQMEDAEVKFAEQLARKYLDDPTSALVSIEKVESFGSSYSYINRLLPAYRVKLDRADGMEVVVDTRTGKLATFDSPSKRVFSTLFSWFHTWSFLGDRDSLLRIITVLIVATLTLFVGLTGLVNLLLFRVKRKSKPARKLSRNRKFHRSLGAFTSLFFLMFTTSAIYHVASKLDYDDSTSWRSVQKIATSQLTATPATMIQAAGPVSSISLAVIEDVAYYRLSVMDRNQPGLTAYYHASDEGVLANGEEIYAKALATEFSQQAVEAISKVEVITKFRRDYGFIFKRLPVTKVSYEDQPYWSYTVDTGNAHLAQRANAAKLVETLSFINLHKWHFLDPLSKELRDYATALATLCIMLVTLLGLSLLRKRKRA